MTRHRIKITAPRRERIDTATLARLLADLAGQPEENTPEPHPTQLGPDDQGTDNEE